MKKVYSHRLIYSAERKTMRVKQSPWSGNATDNQLSTTPTTWIRHKISRKLLTNKFTCYSPFFFREFKKINRELNFSD